ncbi:MAG: Gfo/Idh/MocA family oxidoreductase [Phycisphaerae bacterium]|nr:Gfo/Idh/MocA family oxidoreductase [Phycisphaerae bacterium]
MPKRTTRRTFIRHAAVAGAALPVIAPPLARAASPNSKLNLAGIGVGGKGWGDINSTATQQNVVAFCDVDKGAMSRGGGKPRKAKGGYPVAAEQWPKARRYQDWRKLLDEGRDIDAVTVSTPDHMHAPISMTAMSLGKHVYCQKPLTHTVYEARQMQTLAAESKVVTQMGNQHHSGLGYRMLVQIIRDGGIGKVREAHAWSNRPIWPQGMGRPDGMGTPPDTFDWDRWLGVAPERPYKRGVYCPFVWRGWLDFGTGAQGDMACHIMDPVFWSLNLTAPRLIWSESPTPNNQSYPKWSTIRYEFPGTPLTKDSTIPVTWYDGGRKPDAALAELPKGLSLPSNGSLFIGEKANLLCPHGGAPRLYAKGVAVKYDYPKLDKNNHYMQWTMACLGEGKTSSPFSYAGRLTEMVLLGNIAMRLPQAKLQWNSADLRFTNAPEANQYITKEYRKGWDIPGLT